MSDFNLKAKVRKVKERPRDLRSGGVVPAVLYGHKIRNVFLGIDSREFDTVFEKAGESTLVDLKISGEKKPRQVLIKEVQRDPLSGHYLHIDFYQVKMTEEITAGVVLKFTDRAPAVENLDGVLVKNMNEIEVSCLPRDLPKEIQVSISSLKALDDLIYVRDLDIPKKVKVLENPDEVVVSVSPPRTEEELAELEEAVEEKLEEVEGVKEEEGEEEAKEKEVEEVPETDKKAPPETEKEEKSK